jgi:hypothetical protein
MTARPAARATPRMPYCPCTQEAHDALINAVRNLIARIPNGDLHDDALDAAIMESRAALAAIEGQT